MEKHYVAVCTELHIAMGPIAGWDHAVATARWLTERSQCTFLPVELTLTMQKDETDGGGHYRTGQYL